MRKIISIMLIALMLLTLTAACAEEESGWQNILLLGGDSRSSSRYDRSDSMIILSINRDESLVKMTSIMRDTWVTFPDRGTSGKINAATVYGGPELAVATVNSVFGTDIEDYVIVNMPNMSKIIDLMGGVDVEITASEASYLKIGKSGLRHLDGETAVDYCRIRYIDNDYNRVLRQQKVLLAMADKAQNMELDELSAIAGDIMDFILTNLDDDELEDLMMALMVMDVEEVAQYRIPVDGTFRSGMYNGVWLIAPNFEQNAELLHEFIYGDTSAVLAQ